MRSFVVRAALLASASLTLAAASLAATKGGPSSGAATSQRECFEEGGTHRHCVDLTLSCGAQDHLCRIDDLTGSIIRAMGDGSIKYAAYLARGIASLKALRKADAIADFQAAQALQPRLVTPHMLIGTTLADLGHHARAHASFDEADRLSPGIPAILAQRAAMRQILGDKDGAIEDLSQAIDVMRAGKALPDGAEEPLEALLTTRAEIHMAKGENQAAREDLQAALAAKPGFAPALEALSRLQP